MTHTVHMIGNAHLDPVWLWDYAEGIDTVLATARSACDRLDEYPPFVFTCAGSWFYRQIEEADPALFARIKAFVAAGRWAPVGGMVIQPDCNLPMAESFARQFAHGQRYYRERFGLTTRVGYNVDSFGHTAYLPRFLRDAGMETYCFMRPSHYEKQLPGDVFLWRSPDGAEVTVFHIPMAYCDDIRNLRESVHVALAHLPEGLAHTMYFYGVGDHGGGPTKAQIETILALQDQIEGVRLVFSHPQAFFDAIAPQRRLLPVVQDELQIHAIGCYAVERRIKVPMRRAEHKLLQAERTVAAFAQQTPADARRQLDAAWETVLFNQFHDVLGGTSIDTASRRAAGQLEAVCAEADDLMALVTRRATRLLADPRLHRIVVFNPSDVELNGWVTHGPLDPGVPLLDERNQPVPFQTVDHPSLLTAGSLFALRIPAGEYRVLHAAVARPDDVSFQVQSLPKDPGVHAPFSIEAGTLSNGLVTVTADTGTIAVGDWILALEVRRDLTDTWSHGVDRFNGRKLGRCRFADGWQPKELGPIRAALLGLGTFGHSRVWAQLQQIAGRPMVRLKLAVVWAQERQVLQWRIQAPGRIAGHVDLVSGGPLERRPDGIERPVNGGLILETAAGRLGIVAPELFSLSVDHRGASLTLLRSPYICHHDPQGYRPDQPVTDQGRHLFEIDLYPDFQGGPEKLAALARQALMPPLVWDLTG